MNESISKPTFGDYLAMGLTALVWASAFVAIKVVVPETGPLWLAAWRVLIGFIILIPYVMYRGFIFPTGLRIWQLIVIAGIFNAVIPFFLISWASETIDAGVTSLLMGTGPFLALIGSHFSTTDDRISAPKIIAVLFGFTGVVVIVGPNALAGIGGTTFTAQLAAIGGAFSYVIAGLLVRKIDVPPIRLAWLVLGVSSALLLILAILFEGEPNVALTPVVFWSLIYLGLIPTGLGQILRFVLIRRVGYAAFSLSLNLIPVIGVALGALLLGEVVTIRTAIALILVLAGLFISRMEFGAAKKV